ncbi:MAG: hypothetical protein KF729_10395 [Sandaracinaceae bacterium]|nr:hypothetical protein [Sandaracinaceae bacterium]
MTRRRLPSMRLVIDTNVLRGASRTAGATPPGSTLREVLATVLGICHRAVVSPQLAREYRQPASTYGERWLSAMHRKGKVASVDAKETKRARRWKQSPALVSDAQRAALEKDLHLVLAAMEADGVVVSCETNVRDLLRKVMTEEDVANLGWALVDSKTVAWLTSGALRAAVPLDARAPPARRSRSRRGQRGG